LFGLENGEEHQRVDTRSELVDLLAVQGGGLDDVVGTDVDGCDPVCVLVVVTESCGEGTIFVLVDAIQDWDDVSGEFGTSSTGGGVNVGGGLPDLAIQSFDAP